MSESMIGKSVWRFDENVLVYPKNGGVTGPCIYREHWRLTPPITGETSRSWLIGDRWKVPKSGKRPGWAFTKAEIDDDCWARENRWKIIRLVENAISVCDVGKLREIAKQFRYKADA